MQNKPKSQKSQVDVNNVLTSNYGNWTLGGRGKNKPKTNPIQSQFKPNLKNAKIKLTTCPKRTYINSHTFELFKNEPNSNPIKANSTSIGEKSSVSLKKPPNARCSRLKGFFTFCVDILRYLTIIWGRILLLGYWESKIDEDRYR